jgi:hypothetical protein
MFNYLKRLFDEVYFYSREGNFHKHPLVSALFCKLNRHDYEGINYNQDDNLINLECFYCEKKKRSLL